MNFRRSALLPLAMASLAAFAVGAPPAPAPVPAPATAAPAATATSGTIAKPINAPFALLNAKLEFEPAVIMSITAGPKTPGEIVSRDASGTTHTRPFAEILAVVPGSWAEESAAEVKPEPGGPRPAPVLELTDGQRWPGFLTPDAPETSASGSSAKPAEPPVRWTHERLGGLSVAIDSVGTYTSDREPFDTPDSAAPPSTPTGSDLVWLLNGDRILGVVDHLGRTVRITPRERGSVPVEIDAAQIVQVRLSNPPVAPAGPTVWLADGTVARTAALSSPTRTQIRIDAARSESGPSPADASTPGRTAGNVYSIADLLAFAPDASRLVPLAGLAVDSFSPVKPLIYADPVRILPPSGGVAPLGAADILLPGPMTARWRLPAGAGRICFAAALADENTAWSQCVVRVLVGTPGAEAELARVELDRERRARNVNVDLAKARPGDGILIAVEPGEHGPIQDSVVLRHALLLVNPATK